MPPDLALLPAGPKSSIFVKQGDGSPAKRYVMVARVSALQVPDGDGELCVGGQTAVVDGKSQPLVPDAAIPEVLVGGLRVNRQWFGVGEGRDGNVELGGGGTEVAASVAKIGSFQQRGVGQRLLISLQSVAASHQH